MLTIINNRRAAPPARRLSLPLRPQLSFPLAVTILVFLEFPLYRLKEACSGKGGGGSFGNPAFLDPFAPTEFDPCWNFQEVALIECFPRDSFTYLLYLDHNSYLNNWFRYR